LQIVMLRRIDLPCSSKPRTTFQQNRSKTVATSFSYSTLCQEGNFSKFKKKNNSFSIWVL